MFRNLSFRSRIILLFTSITGILAVVLAGVSYYTVHDIYLRQLERQVLTTCRLAASGFNRGHLDFLTLSGKPGLVDTLYAKALLDLKAGARFEEAFLFDADLKILVSTDSGFVRGFQDPALLLSRTEIMQTAVNGASVSLPFKGADGQWYMWGFFRLDPAHWLGLRENAVFLARIENLAILFWGIGIAGVLVAVVGSIYLARTLARPVEKLTGFSKALESGDWQAPAPVSVAAELETLAHALDQMRNGILAQQKEKEDMLAQIAHEIRNPLGGMELLAGLLAEDLPESARAAEYVGRIRSEIATLKSLITNYLSYGRPAAPKAEWIDIKTIAENAASVLAEQLAKKNVRLECNDNLDRFRFDPSHFRQVMINLISNAANALPEEGLIKISCIYRSGTSIVEVADNGPGIRKELLDRIFEPFFTTGRDGSGLGLAICRRLCRENNSTLEAVNNPDGGCTFRIIQKKLVEDEDH